MPADERPPFVSVYAAAVEEMARLNAEEKGWDRVDSVPVSPSPNPRPAPIAFVEQCASCGRETGTDYCDWCQAEDETGRRR